MPYFVERAESVRPLWEPEPTERFALRRAQVGAAWAVASHFTVTADPAQVVLPTGTGKTGVMTILPFLIPTRRVLAIAPTRIIADQIADEFRTLSLLRGTSAVPEDINGPQVLQLERRVTSLEQWHALRDVDVVVATPNSASPRQPGVAPAPDDLFDLIIFDEAHHVPARTWTALLGHFRAARAALFTATPFRRDRQALPGVIAYEYPLARAIAEGIYQPVEFIRVEEEAGQDPDEVLTRAAAGRLELEVHQRLQSGLLVRTDRVQHAQHLIEVYASVGLQLGLITGKQSRTRVRQVVRQVAEGDLHGIVSIGVLGEGFDMPRLKIAVYHRPHRSLPPTLQFVGRVSRVGPGEETAPAELLAFPAVVQDETRELYESDESWRRLLPNLVDAAVAAERRRRQYVASLTGEPPEDFSVYAVHPKRRVQIFELAEGPEPDLQVEIDRVTSGRTVASFVDEQRELRLIVTQHRYRPDWMLSDALDGEEYELHVLVLDRPHSLLFVSSPTDVSARALLGDIGLTQPATVPPRALNRILHALRIHGYHSIGMRNAGLPGGRRDTYRTMAGTRVNRAVLPSDARTYFPGHLIGSTEDPAGRLRGFGFSIRRAIVWSTEPGDLLSFKEWCLELGARIRGMAPTGDSPPLIPLTIPDSLTRYPTVPLLAGLDESLLYEGLEVGVGSDWIPLIELEPVLTREADDRCALRLEMDNAPVWAASMSLDGWIRPDGNDLPARWPGTGETVWLSDVLNEHSVPLYFADGSVVTGNQIHHPPVAIPAFPLDNTMTLDWSGTNIRREVGLSDDGRPGVQAHMLTWITDLFPGSTVIRDDGSGEIADLIAFRGESGVVAVRLFHCKWSSEDFAGNRLDDIHDVVCQAARSVRWTRAQVLWEELAKRLGGRSYTELLVGDLDETRRAVALWAASPPQTDFTVYVVQPGLRLDGIATWAEGSNLLSCCQRWILDQAASELVVIGA